MQRVHDLRCSLIPIIEPLFENVFWVSLELSFVALTTRIKRISSDGMDLLIILFDGEISIANSGNTSKKCYQGLFSI